MLRLLVLLSFTLAASTPPDRDWTKFPAVVQVDTASEVFAIGDAHSDYLRLTRVIRAAGLIDRTPDNPNEASWTGKTAVLVTTGDMIDKGPRAIDVLMFLRALQRSAASKGGRVIVLAGNHEAEFLADPAAPKGKEFASQLVAAGISPAEVAACRTAIGEFLCSLPFAARVNDSFFSHGGNTAGRTIARLAADLQSGVAKDGFATKQLVGDGSILEARLNGNGPGREPWIDVGRPARNEKHLLTDYTTALGVKHIVEGHVPSKVEFEGDITRQPGEMFQYQGLLFLIDTGMSEGVDSSGGAVLRLTKHDATAICPDGARTLLWDVTKPQPFGRAAPCGK